MDLTPGATQTVSFAGNLFPPVPCRAGFTSQGALPIAVTFTLGTDNTLNQVSAIAQVPGTGN